jgi:hypothetical protein
MFDDHYQISGDRGEINLQSDAPSFFIDPAPNP